MESTNKRIENLMQHVAQLEEEQFSLLKEKEEFNGQGERLKEVMRENEENKDKVEKLGVKLELIRNDLQDQIEILSNTKKNLQESVQKKDQELKELRA